MTDDIGMVLLSIYPSVPHGLMGKVRVLGDTHSIDIATGAVVLLPTEMGVGVREDNLRTTRVHTLTLTGTGYPVLVPTNDILHSETILIVVIADGTCSTVQRTVALFMIRIAPLVPILTDTLVATVLHLPHGLACRLVDI